MTEHNTHRGTDGTSGRPHRGGAIARAAVAIGTGIATAWAHHDIALGVTIATLALNILREVFVRPVR